MAEFSWSDRLLFDVLTIIVFLNVIATIALWREAARKPPKPKKKFIAALLRSEPIVPKHQPPNPEEWLSLMTKEDRSFFDDFADFAAVVNWWLAVHSSWRLQELPETELSLGGISDEPHFGRCYAVFRNQIRLGKLEVSPGFPYSAEEPNVCTRMELSFVRLLTLGTVYDLIEAIQPHVSNPDPNSKEYLEARLAGSAAVTRVLWQTQEISEFDIGEGWGDLELQLNGSASWYFRRREALRKQQPA